MKYRIRIGDAYLVMRDRGHGPVGVFDNIAPGAATSFDVDETARQALQQLYPQATIEPVEGQRQPQLSLRLGPYGLTGDVAVDGQILKCVTGVDLRMRLGEKFTAILQLEPVDLQTALEETDLHYADAAGRPLLTLQQFELAIVELLQNVVDNGLPTDARAFVNQFSADFLNRNIP